MTSSSHGSGGRAARRALGIGALATWLVSGAAIAQPAPGPPPGTEALPPAAEEHFQRGRELYRSGRFREAAAAFDRAYSIQAAPTLLLNTALAYEQAGELRAALSALERFEREATPPERYTLELERAARLLDAVRARLPARLHVQSEPTGARVFVDSPRFGAVGLTPVDVELRPGAHQILVELDGFTPDRRELAVAAGADQALTVALRQARGRLLVTTNRSAATVQIDGADVGHGRRVSLELSLGTHALRVRAPDVPSWQGLVRVPEDGAADVAIEMRGGRSLRPYSWAALGAGALLGLAATGAALLAEANEGTVESSYAQGPAEFDADLQGAESRGRLFNVLSAVGWSAGGALLAGGAILYLLEPVRSTTAEPSAAIIRVDRR